MDFWSKKVCRLCLKLIYNNFTPIDSFAIHMLDVLLLKPKLEISPEPVMCNECEKNLQKSFDFRRIVLKRHTSLIPVINHKETIVQAFITSEDCNVKCQFCMELATQENPARLFKINDIYLVRILKRHISDLNISDMEEYLTCEHCVEYLQSVFNLIWRCLDVEDKIRKYVEIEGMELKDQIELCDVQMYTVKPIKDEISDIAVDEVDIKQQMCSEEDRIAMEHELKIEDIVEIDIPTLYVKMEEIEAEIKQTDNESYVDTASKSNTYKCNKCTYKTKNKTYLKTHMIIHKDRTEVMWHKCTQCPFQTKHKVSLKTHSLVHKVPSEVKMFRCNTCPYETKHKGNLIKHLVIHKNTSELTMYKCDKCTFETKHRNSIYEHQIVHDNQPIVYKCDKCIFMTNRKQNMKKHMLRHKRMKTESDEKFCCDICSYEGKSKRSLKTHMTVHEKPPEEVAFKCDLCSYKTKFQHKLRPHIMSHENPPDETIYKCDKCSYESKSKSGIRNHINRKHNRQLEVKLHKCEVCSFETVHRASLRNHEIRHKDPSEVVIHKCNWCLYESRNKYNVNSHMLTHRIHNPIYKGVYD